MILKSNGRCDCFSQGRLVNSEPDPFCKKCFGTGDIRIKILTPKLRKDPLIVPGEIDEFEKVSLTDYIFFLPSNFNFVTNKDIIATLNDEDSSKLEIFYEVCEKTKYTTGEFSYYEVLARKKPSLNRGDEND